MGTPGNEPRAEEQTEPPGAVANPPFQFRLVHLFLATFLVAVITLLAISVGPGTLPFSIGITLAWLNVQGFFGWLQQKRSRPRVCCVVWLLIAISLILPSAKGCNNKPIKGWQAAQMVIMAEGSMLKKLATTEEPFNGANLVFIVHFTLINLANLLILSSPLFLYRLQKGKGRHLGNALAIAAVSVWVIPWSGPSDFLIGYYVWAGGITLLLFTVRFGWRTFSAMVIFGLGGAAIGAWL